MITRSTHNTKLFTELSFLVPPRELYSQIYKDTIIDYISGVMVDRSETFKDCGYPNIVIEQPLPKQIIYSGDFEHVVDKTAKNIIDRCKVEQKPIAILYSGGIDSTCVASAFLKQNQQIVILGSQASIDENPIFFNEVLCSNPNVILNIGNPLLFASQNSDQYIFVTGECGAHLMGTINWTKYGGREIENVDAVEADHMASGIFKNPEPFFNIPDDTKHMLLRILDKSPKTFKTNYDAQWWSIFVLKWQFVSYRIQLWLGKLCPSFVNFFMTDDFQNWALYNDVTVKCPNYEWRNYKMPMRDYIYSYFPNRNASYDMPKRMSMNRTYKNLSLKGRFVLDEPKKVGFMSVSEKLYCEDYLTHTS